MLRALPSNSGCLQSHRLATGLQAAVCMSARIDPWILNLGIRWVITFMPRPLYSRGNSYRYPLWDWMGTRARSNRSSIDAGKLISKRTVLSAWGLLHGRRVGARAGIRNTGCTDIWSQSSRHAEEFEPGTLDPTNIENGRPANTIIPRLS
jgi:hypothetical protein